MEKEFRVLSLSEENKLSKDELLKYYVDFKEYVLKRKLTNTTPGATTLGPKLKKITTKIAIAVTKMFSDKNVEWVCDGTENIPNETVIFAHTHQGLLDGFVWIPNIERHCLILHGQEVNKLLLLCQLNTGLILVKKEDKKNNLNAKLDMIRLLSEGHSISYFPEGTWNLSPNKLHLPLRFGFLDIARKSGVPVVPVVHEYTYDTSTEKEKITKIHTRYGKPIYISPEDDIKEKLEEYQAAISTMKFELIEEKGLFHRGDIDNFDYINYLKGNYKNLKFGRLDWNKEVRNIYGAQDDFYLFHHVNDVPFNEKGELLETEEVKRLRLINSRNNVHREYKDV